MKILGTSVGHVEPIQAAINARLEEEEEDKLWRALSRVPDLQCLAVVGAMRRPPVPPFTENNASIPRGRIRKCVQPW